MADFNSKITRTLREFDDEYADLDDQDEFSDDYMPPLPLIGQHQFGDIIVELYADNDVSDLRFNVNGVRLSFDDDNAEYLATLDKCWRLA